MRFYDQMLTKFGFGDGDCMPDGVEAYRQVYITGMNLLLEQHQSTIRLVAYNRPGMHNFYLITFVAASLFDTLDDKAILDGEGYDLSTLGCPAALDEAYARALDEASSWDFDQYVRVEVTADLDLLVDALTPLADGASDLPLSPE